MNPSWLSPAHRLLYETYARYWRLWQLVCAYRHLSREGIPLAGKIQEQKIRDFFAPAEIEVSTGSDLGRSQAAVDAATIVFAHTVLDGVAHDYCRVIALHCPLDWATDLERKQVTLAEIGAASYEVLLHRALEKLLKDIERSSLLTKIDLLHKKCAHGRKFTYFKYVFDRERIKHLDDTRHEIIHGGGLGKPIPGIDEYLQFIAETVMYLTALIKFGYGLGLEADLFVAHLGTGA